MTTISRGTVLQARGTGAVALAGVPLLAQDRTAIRIDNAMSKTGIRETGTAGALRNDLAVQQAFLVTVIPAPLTNGVTP
jgi:hypothetical protein